MIIQMFIHPLSKALVLSRVYWSLSQLSFCQWCSTLRTDCQCITGRTYRCRQTFTPKDYLEALVYLTACLWTVGRSHSTWREPTQTEGEHELRTEWQRANPQVLTRGLVCRCEVTVLTTTPPHCNLYVQWSLQSFLLEQIPKGCLLLLDRLPICF